MILPRRSLITGVISLLAAPAIVRAESLMKVRASKLNVDNFLLIGDSICSSREAIEKFCATDLYTFIVYDPPPSP